jgi:hypothetical protein
MPFTGHLGHMVEQLPPELRPAAVTGTLTKTLCVRSVNRAHRGRGCPFHIQADLSTNGGINAAAPPWRGSVIRGAYANDYTAHQDCAQPAAR